MRFDENKVMPLEEQVFRGTNRFRVEAAGAGQASAGSVSQDGYQRCNGLQLAQEVWGLGPSEVRRINLRDEENAKVKRLVAEETNQL